MKASFVTFFHLVDQSQQLIWFISPVFPAVTLGVMFGVFVFCPVSLGCVRASQSTHRQRHQQYVWAGRVPWTKLLYQDHKPEWLWRRPYPPSCSLLRHKSCQPTLPILLHCWAAAVEPHWSTVLHGDHTTQHVRCRTALLYLHGHRCLRWHR